MRVTSRRHVVTLAGALALCCLTATGCQGPFQLSLSPFGGGRWGGRGASAGEVAVIGPPVPCGADETPIVWRASSRSLAAEPAESDLPRELNKVTLPPYRIEPPDVLRIDVVRVVPLPPYRIEPLDRLLIQAPPAQLIPNEPIAGVYPVGPDGQVDLGFSYGQVAVAGLTPEQARDAIGKHVSDVHGIKRPAVSVALGERPSLPPVRGEHPVRLDGTVSLGAYGEAYVAGMTLAEARHAIAARLETALLNPEVSVDVPAPNSKVYYVLFDGGEEGQVVLKRHLAGGETVLDAVSELHALPAAATLTRVWVARPVPGHAGCRRLLPVDWAAITAGAATDTNYQIFPGDRVYVRAEHRGTWAHLECLFGRHD